MISKANYFDKIAEIPYDSLPQALKEGYDTIEFGSKDYTTWEYLEDDPEFLSLYFEKLNAFLDAKDPEPEKDNNTTSSYSGLRVGIRPRSNRSKQFIVWDMKSNQIFAKEYFTSIQEAKDFIEQNDMELVEVLEKLEPEPSKKASSRKTANKKPKTERPEPKRVEQIPAEISFIRRYALLHGKTHSRQKLLTLLSSLQKAMLEKRIRKTSPYANEIMNIQIQLIRVINTMEEQAEISIAKKHYEKYRAIASSERIRESIALLKRYLSIHGKEDMQQKAQRLKEAMERMVKRGKVTKEDPYAQKLEAAYKSLNNFLQKKDAKPAINSGELNGIKALLGQRRICCESKPKPLNSTLSSEELLKMQFDTIGLKGKFRDLIGDPSKGFTAMVFGQPKSGKSTLMLQFAHELAKNHGKVLYAAIEEGYGYTLKEKIQRTGAIHPRLEFAEKLPGNLSTYDFIFIDSVSRAGMELEDLIELKTKHPTTSFIFIFHSTKDGKFRGENNLAHEVDIIIEIEPGLAKASGRFSAGGEMGF